MNDVLLNFFLIFCFYAFMGWLLETGFKTVRDGHFVNSGFLHGPFVPLYGTGALVIVGIISWTEQFLPQANPLMTLVLQLLLAIVATSCIEYITGWAMEKFFHCSWWDYSDESFNLHGRICLKYSLFWGFLSLFVLDMLNPLIRALIADFPIEVRSISTALLVAYLVADLSSSIAEALGLKRLMADFYALTLEPKLGSKLESAREEALSARMAAYHRLIDAFPGLSANYQGELKYFRIIVKQYRNYIVNELTRLENERQALGDMVIHRVSSARTELENRVDNVRAELEMRVDMARTEIENRVDGARNGMENRVDSARNELANAREEALALQIAAYRRIVKALPFKEEPRDIP